MSGKGKKLESDVIKILKSYKLLQKEFDEREAQFRLVVAVSVTTLRPCNVGWGGSYAAGASLVDAAL
jgi:hypothetical protein